MPTKLNVLPDTADRQPWYTGGLSFSCTCSGNCCSGGPGYVWIDDEEIDRLAEHFKLSREQALAKYCRKIGRKISLKERRNRHGTYDCIFLTEIEAKKEPGKVAHRRRVCGIYQVRPLQCRSWPFWEGNLLSKEDWEHAARRCPGMNRGRAFTKDQIETIRDSTEWPAEPPTSDGR